jgi:hypothetical protein
MECDEFHRHTSAHLAAGVPRALLTGLWKQVLHRVSSPSLQWAASPAPACGAHHLRRPVKSDSLHTRRALPSTFQSFDLRVPSLTWAWRERTARGLFSLSLMTRRFSFPSVPPGLSSATGRRGSPSPIDAHLLWERKAVQLRLPRHGNGESTSDCLTDHGPASREHVSKAPWAEKSTNDA